MARSTRTTPPGGANKKAAPVQTPAAGNGEPVSAFEADVKPALAALARSLSEVIRSLPNGPIEGPRQLQRALDIEYLLAWRVFKVASAPDPAHVGTHVPRAVPMGRFLDLAARHRAKATAVARARRAYEAYEKLVHHHGGEGPKRGRGSRTSGGRAVFDSMVGGIADDGGAITPATRRAAFRNMADLWGVQVRTDVRCAIWHPGSKPTTMDGALIWGYAHAQSLRRGVGLRLTSRASGIQIDGSGKPLTGVASPFESAELLTEFCTKPLPRVNNWIDGARRVTKLDVAEPGKRGAIDCFMTQALYDSSIESGEGWGASVMARLPAETLMVDLLIPQGWASRERTRAVTYGCVASVEDAYALRDEDRLPAKEELVYQGSDLDVLETSDVPRYPEMIATVLRHLGWGGSTFEVFRCRVSYPILHSVVDVRVHDAPKP